MKNTTYGDEINQSQVNTSALELLTSEDKVSANSINRPLQNIFEDEEASYLLLQNLIKNITSFTKTDDNEMTITWTLTI